jgi:hypothetical protein
MYVEFRGAVMVSGHTHKIHLVSNFLYVLSATLAMIFFTLLCLEKLQVSRNYTFSSFATVKAECQEREICPGQKFLSQTRLARNEIW